MEPYASDGPHYAVQFRAAMVRLATRWSSSVNVRRLRTGLLVMGLLSFASAQQQANGACASRWLLDPRDISGCLYREGVLSLADRDSANRVFDSVARLQDSLTKDPSNASFERAAEVSRALAHISDFYSRRLFGDSSRFHRMLDHLLVTAEHARGTIRKTPDGRLWPQTTPYLSWVVYPGLGIYFQPVTTAHSLAYLIPRKNAPTDTVLAFAEHAYRYALWRTRGGYRFPVWEYDYTMNSGTVINDAPWISSQAQGGMLALFAEAYERTGARVWRDRAFEVLNSFRVEWDSGGVLVSDTSHGYWWEQYNPLVRVWNGAAQAVVAIGYLYQVTHDSSAKRMFDRGIDAMRYYTPYYDTGRWTIYSRTHGYESVAYHRGDIEILEALYTLSGDPWFKAAAERWRTYVPPAGVQ